MQPASRFMRRFWWSCLIMLGLLALAAPAAYFLTMRDDTPYKVDFRGPWPWGLVVLAVLVVPAGPLILWRGRRMQIAAILSCLLLVLLTGAWAGTLDRHAEAYVHFRYETSERAHTFDARVASDRGCLMLEWNYVPDPLELPGAAYASIDPGVRLSAGWDVWTELPLERRGDDLVDWPWLRRRAFQLASSIQARGSLPATYDFFLAVPHWFVLPWLLIFPALYGRRCWKLAHAPMGPRCANCGYDLRGHPPLLTNAAASDASPAASAKCPECGTPIPAAAPVPPEA